MASIGASSTRSLALVTPLLSRRRRLISRCGRSGRCSPTRKSPNFALIIRVRPLSRHPRAGDASLCRLPTYDWCRRLAKFVANSTRQRIDEESPLLSAALPSGERIQIALPPATTQGCIALTIRRPSNEVWSLQELTQRGLFRATRRATEALDATEIELLDCFRRKTTNLSCASRFAAERISWSQDPRGPVRPPTPRRSFRRSRVRSASSRLRTPRS